jgi:hypothetical protein
VRSTWGNAVCVSYLTLKYSEVALAIQEILSKRAGTVRTVAYPRLDGGQLMGTARIPPIAVSFPRRNLRPDRPDLRVVPTVPKASYRWLQRRYRVVLGVAVGSPVWRSHPLFHQLALPIANHIPRLVGLHIVTGTSNERPYASTV